MIEVEKRDGSIVDFDPLKIFSAIYMISPILLASPVSSSELAKE